MKLNPEPSVTELTDDELLSRLSVLETRYGNSSETFPVRFNRGQLGDCDLIRILGDALGAEAI